jgi:hypothetical protein
MIFYSSYFCIIFEKHCGKGCVVEAKQNVWYFDFILKEYFWFCYWETIVWHCCCNTPTTPWPGCYIWYQSRPLRCADMWSVVAYESALDLWTCPRGEVSGLGLTDEDVGLLRGWVCDILAQDLIGLIGYSYQHGFFSGSSSEKNSGLSVLGLEQFKDGDRPESCSRVRTSEDKVCRKD